MGGNSFGKLFRVTTFGESHGSALGVVIDGMPAGITINPEELKQELKRRAPGQHQVHTSRKELDEPEILSGIFEGKTLGSPITVIVRNHNQQSTDYDSLKEQYRPGHADRTTLMKYGIRDHRGSGRASGRETVARVIAGYFAGLIIPSMSVYAYINQVGPFKLKKEVLHGSARGEINIPDEALTKEVIEFLNECKANGESAGGTISLSITNCPSALGEPVFDKLKAELAKAMLSIPACMGFSIGNENIANMLGSEVSSDSKNFGGMEGGISNGEEIHLKLTFKAPSTIGEKAQSGRHDPCVLPRVIPVVEAMAKIVIADHFLRQMSYSSFLPANKDQ
jgi:chorismate synthase